MGRDSSGVARTAEHRAASSSDMLMVTRLKLRGPCLKAEKMAG